MTKPTAGQIASALIKIPQQRANRHINIQTNDSVIMLNEIFDFFSKTKNNQPILQTMIMLTHDNRIKVTHMIVWQYNRNHHDLQNDYINEIGSIMTFINSYVAMKK